MVNSLYVVYTSSKIKRTKRFARSTIVYFLSRLTPLDLISLEDDIFYYSTDFDRLRHTATRYIVHTDCSKTTVQQAVSLCPAVSYADVE